MPIAVHGNYSVETTCVWRQCSGIIRSEVEHLTNAGCTVRSRYIRIPLGYRLANMLVYNKIKAALGLEHCKMAATGAAPISVDTLECPRPPQHTARFQTRACILALAAGSQNPNKLSQLFL